MEEVCHKLYKEDDTYLALWEYKKEVAKNAGTVFLNHGTYSNRKIMIGITEYLVRHGYHCWILEWPEHGKSSMASYPYDFETIGRDDFKLAIDYVRRHSSDDKIDVVAHSGGGICMTIFLCYYPAYQDYIGRMCFLATQAFAAYDGLVSKAKIRFGSIMMRLTGKSAGKFTGSPHDEKPALMGQWFQWNMKREFTGRDGRDFKKCMADIKLPLLMLAGEGDTFIAPYDAMEKYKDCFGSEAELLLCGKATGFSENFSHGRIALSSAAAREVYPLIFSWVKEGESAIEKIIHNAEN